MRKKEFLPYKMFKFDASQKYNFHQHEIFFAIKFKAVENSEL